jgi:hypothetical protein
MAAKKGAAPLAAELTRQEMLASLEKLCLGYDQQVDVALDLDAEQLMAEAQRLADLPEDQRATVMRGFIFALVKALRSGSVRIEYVM